MKITRVHTIAAPFHVKALAIMTISNAIVTTAHPSFEERENTLEAL
jgi:purine-nucleoside phosphorylase